MSEPIIIDGHAQKVTITVPSNFKLTNAGDTVTIEVDADPGKPFERVVVKDMTKQVERFRSGGGVKGDRPNGLQSTWNIRIGRDETEI